MATVKIVIKIDEEPLNENLNELEFVRLEHEAARILLKNKRFFASKDFMKSTNEFTDKELENMFGRQEFVFMADSQELCGARCFCMTEDAEDGYDVFQWSDYVTRPMVWCQNCGARSVICIDCPPDFEMKDGKATFIYPLVTIDKVLSTQLYSWKWTPELFKEHIDEFLAIRRNKDLYYSKKIKAEEEFAAKIGLEPRESESEEEDLSDLWEIAPVINSVDGKTPPIPLDMAHDGILIYHTCHHDICGAKFECRYWGD